jgi:putative transposase
MTKMRVPQVSILRPGNHRRSHQFGSILLDMPQGLVRYHQTGNFHFLTFSCYHRLPYLTTPSAREAFEESLERMRIRYRFVVAGYVVMPEHVHLLLSEPQIGILSTAIQALKLSVTRQRSERPFWQARYYDFTVHSSEKTAEKLRYIHRNPVARGLVSKPEEWPCSSFRHYRNGERGRVEIESFWTAAARGYELPEGFEIKRMQG